MSDVLIQESLRKAYTSVENDDLVSAMDYTKKILNENSDHPLGLELMGFLLLELNCLEEATFCFIKSIENGNTENHTPHLYLGQLTSGDESVTHFLKAAEMIESFLSHENDGKIRLFKPSKLDLSNCYVSLSEIYMTDLCDNEDAEEQCRLFITKSVDEDATNPASWQALASLNLILNDKDNCKINIEKSLVLWLTDAKKIMSDAEAGEDDEMNNEIITTCELSAEFRTKTAEILFELAMFEDMRSVLESILIEDEEHMQAHYLMATLLEAEIESSSETKDGLKEELVAHADMALNLADAEVEKDAVEKMTGLLEKYASNCQDCSSCSEDDSESEDEME